MNDFITRQGKNCQWASGPESWSLSQDPPRKKKKTFTYCTYVIDEQFRYTTGVKVSYLRKSWTKSVVDYVGAIRKVTVGYRYRHPIVALHIASPILAEKGGDEF